MLLNRGLSPVIPDWKIELSETSKNIAGASPGWFMTDYTSSIPDMTPNEQTVYWEPADWTYYGDGDSAFDFEGTLTLTMFDGSTFIKKFRIDRRLLEPNQVVPMQGSDVAMLEEMLWQFGVSPQANNPGSEGARINSLRYRTGTTKTTPCVSGQDQKRDVYLTFMYPCGPDGKGVSTELMVKRFNARRRETGTIVTATEAMSASGTVDEEVLGWLGEDWNQYYFGAYKDLQTVNGIFDQNGPGMDAWFNEAVGIWQNGVGTKVPATLNDDMYNLVLTEAGLTNNSRAKKDLLVAWMKEETQYHWGDNPKHYQKTKYRMTEGGADENGSLSFSQLLYHYRYGPNPCAAHKEAGKNLYHPGDNLKSFVIHSAANNTSDVGTKACQGGMYRAFVSKSLRVQYNSGASLQPVSELKGYINNADGTVVTKALTEKEDDYEALAKAIGIYNGNTNIFTSKSWPWVLRYLQYVPDSKENTGLICHSCRYSIDARNKPNVLENNLRRYVWYGGKYPLTLPDGTTPHPNAGQDWCFAYGEKEWVDGKKWKDMWKNADKYVSGFAPAGTADPTVACQ